MIRKGIRIPRLLVPGIVLAAVVILCMGNCKAGDFYALHIYPVVSSVLSLVASPFGFSLQTVLFAVFIATFVAIIIRAHRQKRGFLHCLLKEITLVVWIFVWAYLGWCTNYSRSQITTRVESPATAYDSTAFRTFLSEFTDELNASWVDDVTIDGSLMEKEIKTIYESVPAKYGLCRPRKWQHYKKMPFSRLESAMGILGYIGPFFCESHLNPEIPAVDVPNTFAHEYSHLLGVSCEAEANWWAFQCCSRSNVPGMKYSGYQSMLSHVIVNASHLLSEEDFNAWAATLRQEVKDDYKANREFWSSKKISVLDNAQRWIYDLFLKTNNISSGVRNYSEVVSLMISLDYQPA